MLAADLHDERNSEFGSAGCCLLPGESNSVILSLPLVTLGLFVHCLQLRRKLDKKNLLFRNAMKELIKNRQTSCRDSGDSDFQSFKNSLTCLFCAFAEDSDLSEEDQKDLLDFIDKF